MLKHMPLLRSRCFGQAEPTQELANGTIDVITMAMAQHKQLDLRLLSSNAVECAAWGYLLPLNMTLDLFQIRHWRRLGKVTHKDHPYATKWKQVPSFLVQSCPADSRIAH